jgi:hypothetical protein
MNSRDIAHLRLINQHLAAFAQPARTPADLVKWMACIQAQDFGMAKWALGCRLSAITDADIERDFNEGEILRTHALRPTWHFVCPEDVCWMLKFNAPKVRALSRPYHRQLGIDAAVLKKCKTLLTSALEEHRRLTRPQLAEVLRKGKIATDEARLGHLLMEAELDAIICSAGRIGKQFAYRLLDFTASQNGRDPQPKTFNDDEAIVELARRYFPSRGPATIQDFAWWAGLTLTEARKGLDGMRTNLESVELNGLVYWFVPTNPSSLESPAATSTSLDGTHLLPAFDEYTVAYKNREDVLNPRDAAACSFGLKPIVVHKTRVIGTWQRSIEKGKAVVEINTFARVKPAPARALAAVLKKYDQFVRKKHQTRILHNLT